MQQRMILFLCIIVFLHTVLVQSSNSSFDIFTNLWQRQHASWVGNLDYMTNCHDEDVFYPTCIGNKKLDLPHDQCAAAVCVEKSSCPFTPQDTTDYIPPASTTTPMNSCDKGLRSGKVFGQFFSLDNGIPPLFVPYDPIPLHISGKVIGNVNGHCMLLQSTIDFWQADHPAMDADVTGDLSLREKSCRGHVFTHSNNGSYEFWTTIPPSYGPPRHVNFVVHADGYEPLITRMYIDKDRRLHQLTRQYGVDDAETWLIEEHEPRSGFTRGFDNDDDITRGEENALERRFPGRVGQDPRVARLRFVSSDTDSAKTGYAAIEFSLVLKPLRSAAKDTAPVSAALANPNPLASSTILPLNISGFWTDMTSPGGGGLVLVETMGNRMIAVEYPHPRSWGMVMGVLVGDFVRGVDFRATHIPTTSSENGALYPWRPASASDALSQLRLPDLETELKQWRLSTAMHASWDNTDLSTVNTQETGSLTTSGFEPFLNVFSKDELTGVIVNKDPYASAPTATTISWYGYGTGGFRGYWSRQETVPQYRYLQIRITRETSGTQRGRLRINEIRFFTGVVHQYELPSPSRKMKAPKYPYPQIVTCSSFTDSAHHCYKAFDGRDDAGSFWESEAVGERDHILSQPQWVTMDLGPNRMAHPTAVQIACDVENVFAHSGPAGCPMTFAVLASHDNKQFDVLHTVDMFDYHNDYGTAQKQQLLTNGSLVGKYFSFTPDSATGYPVGHRCGSCAVPPKFQCHLNGFDGTCSTAFCGPSGVCEETPVCGPGEYLHQEFVGYDETVFECKQCPPGTYGSVAGLRDPACSGLCDEGYYCPAGSTSPTAVPCGSVDRFCPRGSGSPIAAGAGKRTVTGVYPIDNAVADSLLRETPPVTTQTAMHVGDGRLRSAEIPCSMGHYCVGGVEIPCPLGTYGNSTGLDTVECSGQCVAGEYCPVASVVPQRCPKGYYCPDGRVRHPCPAGTYGAILGLRLPSCSGLCRPGHYCEPGSVSATAAKCPAGRYGSTWGLTSASCSGPCAPGYYCPAGSVNGTAVACGGTDVYCPGNVGSPVPIRLGHYSTEGSTQETLATEKPCEKGFFCEKGVKHPCPAGTYGEVEGLHRAIMRTKVIAWGLGSASAPATAESADMWAQELVTAPVTNAPTSQPTVQVEASSGEYIDNVVCSGWCARGHYCPLNSTSNTQFPCPAGRFGNREGLRNELCSGPCPLGHYCPLGAIAPLPCKAGTFGNVTGLTTAACNPRCYDFNSQSLYAAQQALANQHCQDNLCHPGYYCPEGSISGTERECGGSDVYCPRGSTTPSPVLPGFYTITMPDLLFSNTIMDGDDIGLPVDRLNRDRSVSSIRTHQKQCEKGYYCAQGVKRPCPAGVYGDRVGLSSADCSGPCPPGHYCPAGTASATAYRCPAGRYGATKGLHDSSCSGVCAAGHYCPEASVSPQQIKCGMGSAHGPNAVYCLPGSLSPILVHPGQYSAGGDMNTRSEEVPCPPGSYCVDGVIHDCPAGRYGRTDRLTSSDCSGPCQRGYYCPPGSTSRNERPCPAGRYGATEGLSSIECSGACPNPLHCPAGSVDPMPPNTKRAGDIW